MWSFFEQPYVVYGLVSGLLLDAYVAVQLVNIYISFVFKK